MRPVRGRGKCNCFLAGGDSQEEMTAQSRYVNKEKPRGGVLIPAPLPVDQPSRRSNVSQMCPSALWIRFDSNGCFAELRRPQPSISNM